MARKIVFLLVLIYIFKQHNCRISPKYVNCTSIDANFSRFDLCELKKNKSGKDEMSLIVRLLQLPITNCRLQMELFNMKTNLSFNTTWDFCQFMANSKKFRPLLTFYNLVKRSSNINHSCPYYETDIILNKLEINNLDARIPWPSGDYVLRTTWIFNRKVRIAVDVAAFLKK